MNIRAVITGDVINSTRLSESEYKTVMDRLNHILQKVVDNDMITRYEIYRGDAFQAFLDKPEDGLSALFLIKTYINALSVGKEKRGKKIEFNIRLGLGVGQMNGKGETLLTNEEPFVLSGRALDKITELNHTVAIKTTDENLNREFSTELLLLEFVMEQWTPTSAGIVHHKLLGKTERDIADHLDISQSAVNQQSRKSCWNGLKAVIDRYKQVIQQMRDNKK